MSKLAWDLEGERFYETGVDRAVLYVKDSSGEYGPGVAWNGITGIDEKPTGAEPTAIYADNIKYLNLMSKEEFEATIKAYTYPDEFYACDGSSEITSGVVVGQQSRTGFGLAYRTLIGNDTQGTSLGYKLHIVYGCMASPSEKSRETVNETPAASELSWELTTTPVDMGGNLQPSATITIDSTQVASEDLKALEDILYGTDAEGEELATEPRLPLPDEIRSLFED